MNKKTHLAFILLLSILTTGVLCLMILPDIINNKSGLKADDIIVVVPILFGLVTYAFFMNAFFRAKNRKNISEGIADIKKLQRPSGDIAIPLQEITEEINRDISLNKKAALIPVLIIVVIIANILIYLKAPLIMFSLLIPAMCLYPLFTFLFNIGNAGVLKKVEEHINRIPTIYCTQDYVSFPIELFEQPYRKLFHDSNQIDLKIKWADISSWTVARPIQSWDSETESDSSYIIKCTIESIIDIPFDAIIISRENAAIKKYEATVLSYALSKLENKLIIEDTVHTQS